MVLVLAIKGPRVRTNLNLWLVTLYKVGKGLGVCLPFLEYELDTFCVGICFLLSPEDSGHCLPGTVRICADGSARWAWWQTSWNPSNLKA